MIDGRGTWIGREWSEGRRLLVRATGAALRGGPGQIRFWFVALGVGIASGIAAVLFRLGIEVTQARLYGTDDILTLHSFAASLSWQWVVGIPVAGGLAVGLLTWRFTEDGRVRSVAEVIEGATLREGRIDKRRGLVSALASMITLSSGGSTGREGPVVHLASVIATYVNDWTGADGVRGRDLLGCAVAAAVSASFNAPIAGALFALEVILRHFAVRAFAPIVIASVAGTVVSRLVFGEATEFSLVRQTALEFYVELPAFLLLGLVCGVVGVVLMQTVFWCETRADRLQRATGLPGWARPGVSGLLLGLIATQFPHVIGVGYETTNLALSGGIGVWAAVVFVAVKVVAVAVTFAGRMGGGIFSPSLMVGALTGIAFGTVATGLFPAVSGDGTLYALAGMGAVAAAVLGAPISTTLIVFELTGDWQAGLAVMVSVSLSAALASRMVDRSFFLTQLERRGIHLAAGPQAWLLGTFRVESVMRAVGAPRGADEARLAEMVRGGTYLEAGQTLEFAMPVFERTGESVLPVVSFGPGETDAPPEIWGALFQVDALRALNRAMAAAAKEEHS